METVPLQELKFPEPFLCVWHKQFVAIHPLPYHVEKLRSLQKNVTLGPALQAPGVSCMSCAARLLKSQSQARDSSKKNQETTNLLHCTVETSRIWRVKTDRSSPIVHMKSPRCLIAGTQPAKTWCSDRELSSCCFTAVPSGLAMA